MVKSFGQDLRWRVVFLHVIFGQSPRKIARNLLVSLSWVYKILKRHRQTGNVKEMPRFGRPRILLANEQSLLRNLISAHPQLYLDETRDWFSNVTGRELSVHTVRNYFSRMGLTHKQLNHAAIERNELRRQEYREFVSQFSADMFVFVDESSKNSRTPQRSHGYMPKGRNNMPFKCDFVKKEKLSVMAALDYHGILGHLVVEGSFTAELFNLAFSLEVLPYLGQFLHLEERSIVVLDNCRVQNAELVDMIRKKGAIAMFLPPYSPDMMPMEFSFHFMKSWLRRHQGYAAQHPKLCIIMALEDITENMAQNYIHACGY